MLSEASLRQAGEAKHPEGVGFFAAPHRWRGYAQNDTVGRPLVALPLLRGVLRDGVEAPRRRSSTLLFVELVYELGGKADGKEGTTWYLDRKVLRMCKLIAQAR